MAQMESSIHVRVGKCNQEFVLSADENRNKLLVTINV